jgi:hypothetical protein
MAKKTARKNANRVQAKLPKGFTAVNAGGSFGAWHDFNKQKTLTGVVVDHGSFKQDQDYTDNKGKKKTRVVDRRTLTIKNGKILSTVSESAGTKGLFDMGFKALKGKTVFIQFLGKKKLKGGRSFNQYAVGVK